MCPEYADANNRLRSFVGQPLPAGQTAEALANAGFFYIGKYIGIPYIILANSYQSSELSTEFLEHTSIFS